MRAIRLAALSDSPDAFGARYEDEAQKPVSEFEQTAIEHAESESSTTFLAKESGAAIGQIGAFFQKPTGRAFICAMWVSPEVRRKEVGSRLVNMAHHWLQDRGADEIYAWVTDTNIAAQQFYRRLGFSPSGTNAPLPSNPRIMETLYVYSS